MKRKSADSEKDIEAPEADGVPEIVMSNQHISGQTKYIFSGNIIRIYAKNFRIRQTRS